MSGMARQVLQGVRSSREREVEGKQGMARFVSGCDEAGIVGSIRRNPCMPGLRSMGSRCRDGGCEVVACMLVAVFVSRMSSTQ